MPDEPFDLEVADVARLLEIGRSTVRRLADFGSIPCYRTPGGNRRFRRTDVDAYRARRMSGAPAS